MAVSLWWSDSCLEKVIGFAAATMNQFVYGQTPTSHESLHKIHLVRLLDHMDTT